MIQLNRSVRALLAGVVALFVFAGPAAAEESAAREGGWGALAAVGTLLYSPAKVVYAGCGLLFGGIAWGLSGGDREVLDAVITPAVRGDYVLVPAHVRGERRLEFFGRDPRYDTLDVAAEPRPAPVYSEDPGGYRAPEPEIREERF
jgi:hypothetical protein